MEEFTNQLLTYKGLIVVSWLLILFVLERLMPASIPDNDSEIDSWSIKIFPGRLRRNIGLWLCNVVLSPLVIIPLTLWASLHTISWRPEAMRGAPGLIFDVLLLDVLIYWWHRLNHEMPFLWRFHEVHHLDDSLDTTSAFRFHFGEVLLSALMRAIVVVLFDISFVSIIIFETIILIATIFHHSNLKLGKGFENLLSHVIITPEIHWVHHHALRSDTDSNYGTIFSCWDKVFKTRSPNSREPGMRIGVEGSRDKELYSLLLRPFKFK